MSDKCFESSVISLRLGDREYDYLDGLVDGFYFDSISMVIHFMILECMVHPEYLDPVRLFGRPGAVKEGDLF